MEKLIKNIFKQEPVRVTVCVIVALTLMLGFILASLGNSRIGAQPAHAVSGQVVANPEGSGYLTYTRGKWNMRIGSFGKTQDGHNVYCIETDLEATLNFSDDQQVADSDDARRIAYLADAYENNMDPLTQGAIGVLVHDHFEAHDKAAWVKRKAMIFNDYPQIQQRINELWNEASSKVVSSMRATYGYTTGMRTGRIKVQVTNSSGQSLQNIPVTLTLKGPAVFDKNNQATLQVNSSDGDVEITWHATGTGEVTVEQGAQVSRIRRLITSQDYVTLGNPTTAYYNGIHFNVRKEFKPMISTVAKPRIIDENATVVDSVTSGVAQGDVWEKGVSLNAQGYFYTGIDENSLRRHITPKAGQSAHDFINQLAKQGFSPVAFGKATFTGANQTQNIEATVAPDSDQKYTNDASTATFGTWVWVIDRSEQTAESQQWIDSDVVSPFLDIPETVSLRKKVSVDSTVTEHTAIVGSTLSDHITVSGFPDNHPRFSGNKEFGWKQDTVYAQVSIYWSGDKTNPENDVKYKPNTIDPPALDEHHALIGTWDYAAKNGDIKIGGGRPDAHGKKVHINAETHGYYVFVYSFAGDDRVLPVSSAYNDEWECAQVVEHHEETNKKVSLVTATTSTTVQPGEPFADTAMITGDIEDGAYITFTAFDAVKTKNPDSSVVKLLDEKRVDINKSIDLCTTNTAYALKSKALDSEPHYCVRSPEVSTHTEGTSYWKATVWNAEGEILASHTLGAENENTSINPHEPSPKTPSSNNSLARTGASVSPLALAAGLLLSIGVVTYAIIFISHKGVGKEIGGKTNREAGKGLHK